MRKLINFKKYTNNNGYALLSTILALAVISIIGTSIILVTYNNFAQSSVLSNYEEIYYTSESMTVLATDAIKKSATSEINKLQEMNATNLPANFLQTVINNAKLLLPSEILANSAGADGVYMSISETNTDIIDIRAISRSNNLRRQTKIELDLVLTSIPAGASTGSSYFELNTQYSTFISGDVYFPEQHSANTTIIANPGGIFLGDVVDYYAGTENFTSDLPPAFSWWDSTFDSILDLTSDMADGQIIISDENIISKSTDATLQITQNSGQTVIGSQAFVNLKDMVLLVDGSVEFSADLMFNLSKFTNFMVFATGDITIDSSANNNAITDNIFLYSGGNLYFYDIKGGANHYLSFYTKEFHYSNMDKGSSKPVFYGQFYMRDAMFSVSNGNLTVNFNYSPDYVDIFYTKLNALANTGVIDGNVVTDGEYGDYGNIFVESKIVETVVP